MQNSSDDFLVYEQDEVQIINESHELPLLGKLRIVDRCGDPFIEWCSNLDDSSDSEWAVISDVTTSVSFMNQKQFDGVTINNCRKSPRSHCIKLSHLRYCKVSENKKDVELLGDDWGSLGVFIFHSEHSDYFFDVLHRYVKTIPQEQEPGLHMVQSLAQAVSDEKLLALNLVPDKRLYGSTGSAIPWHYGGKKVLGFLNDIKKDPYRTTLTTLSTVYDVILNGDIAAREDDQGDDDKTGVAEILHKISGRDDFEPGFELITKHEYLAERPEIERLSPMNHEEFAVFVDHDGRIKDLDVLKLRIFRGGLSPNLRPIVWPLLLANPPIWDLNSVEYEELMKEKEQNYNTMKRQWETISEEQELNFSGFRDRKSIVEKDVNRTDRSHPFYEGESNTNLVSLHNILMTYVMFNFDLGYVQGMSDLLAPILYVTQQESTAFWAFVGHMDRVYHNFDLDQSGMKQQLSDLSQLLRILDPEFMAFLEVQDSANLYFCFRWLLVRFKRELNYSDTLRLWEVLWTDKPCKNFHLLICTAILDSERDELLEKKFGFTDILKHINCLTLQIDLNETLKKAESMFRQLEASPAVPNPVRSIIGLPPQPSMFDKDHHLGYPGRATRISPIDSDKTATEDKENSPNIEEAAEAYYEEFMNFN